MANFDSIINEVSQKFDMGSGKAQTLLSILLDLLTNRETGGFTGFIERFNQVGLGDTATSWVITGDNAAISNEQTESAFGEETLGEISEQAAVDREKTTSALAYMTPKVVDILTPDGEIPVDADVFSRIDEYSTAETSDIVDDKTTAAAATGSGGAVIVSSSDEIKQIPNSPKTYVNNPDDDEGSSLLFWLLPLVILGALMVVGFYACSDRKGKPAIHKDSAVEEGVKKNETKQNH